MRGARNRYVSQPLAPDCGLTTAEHGLLGCGIRAARAVRTEGDGPNAPRGTLAFGGTRKRTFGLNTTASVHRLSSRTVGAYSPHAMAEFAVHPSPINYKRCSILAAVEAHGEAR